MRNPSAERRRSAILAAALVAVMLGPVAAGAGTPPREHELVFDPGRFTVESATVDGRTVEYRAYTGITYVKHPVDTTYECMNIFVPTAYGEGGSIGGYDARTAPIFFPISVGGYMPARPARPRTGADGRPNAALVALSRGCVVAAPGARGRTSQDASGAYTGKAPAAIVDLKAAVRYLRLNDERMPGDAEKIVSNGTSAGGALSALLGASGNSADFEPYLKALGAAEARDDIHAVSAYCPITDLDHADAAYEWQFNGVNDFSRVVFNAPPGGPAPAGGAPPQGEIRRSVVQGTMTPEQIRLSALLEAEFPAYVNGLGLKQSDGTRLSLDSTGHGTFRDLVKSCVIASAQKALAGGTDLTALTWLTIEKGTVTGLDFDRFVRFATRMKVAPAFDGQDLRTPENELFGTATVNARHFTRFGQDHTTVPATLAEASTVQSMNPLHYLGAAGATTAKSWRIRHGTVDRDNSLAIPVILATRLENTGHAVDFAIPWGVGHSGDYDLEELFDWLARVCR